MSLQKNRSRYFLPIKFAIYYNLFTLLLFVFGAWNYNVMNYPAVIAIVVSNLFALYVGYYVAMGQHKAPTSEIDYNLVYESKDKKTIILLKKWTLIAAVMALPDTLYYSRMWSMSLDEIIQRFGLAFTQSNLNYSLSLNYQDSGTLVERVVVLANVLLYFFKFAVLPITVLLWRKVDTRQKILCIYIEVMEIVKWLLKGMNKGIFDFVFVMFASTIILIISNALSKGGATGTVRRLFRKQKKRLIFGAILFTIIAIFMFISNGQARTSGNTTKNTYYSNSMDITADSENVLLNLFPKELHTAVLGIDMYITNGYQGLSYALRMPFEWCYGLGNNQFLISNFRDAFGIDVSNMTYQARIESRFPWQEAHNWHSIYVWLANDVSFIFLPMLFFVYGFMFAKSWIDSIEKHNPYAIVVFCFFVIRFFYLSANNQITSSSFSFLALFIALALWYFSNHNNRISFTNHSITHSVNSQEKDRL